MHTCTHAHTTHTCPFMYVHSKQHCTWYVSTYVCTHEHTHTDTTCPLVTHKFFSIFVYCLPDQAEGTLMTWKRATLTHSHRVDSTHTTWTGWLCTSTTHGQGENELSSAPSTLPTPPCVHPFKAHLANDIPNCVLVNGQVIL